MYYVVAYIAHEAKWYGLFRCTFSNFTLFDVFSPPATVPSESLSTPQMSQQNRVFCDLA